MTSNLLWIKGAAGLLLLSLLAWGVNTFLNYEQGIGYDRRTAEYLVQENKDLKAAKDETIRLNSVILEAQNEAKKREDANRQLSARIGVLNGRLRDTTGNINRLVSSATENALRNATRTYGTLFGECREAYDAMGQAAAGHLSDVEKLEASWPIQKDVP